MLFGSPSNSTPEEDEVANEVAELIAEIAATDIEAAVTADPVLIVNEGGLIKIVKDSMKKRVNLTEQ